MLKWSWKPKLALLVLVGLVVVRYVFFRAPSESEMIAHFKSHQAKFEQLRFMLQQDKRLSALGSGWMGDSHSNLVETPEEIGISPQRLAQYRSLMDDLKVVTIGHRQFKNTFQFSVFGGGFADTTWSIGYFWSEKTPENMVPSAYNAVPHNRCHSLLEGKWYLYHYR